MTSTATVEREIVVKEEYTQTYTVAPKGDMSTLTRIDHCTFHRGASPCSTCMLETEDYEVEAYEDGNDGEQDRNSGKDDDDDATLFFVTEHVAETDSDGYSPPKSLVMDGFVLQWAQEALDRVAWGKNWQPAAIDCYDGFSMERVYVAKRPFESTTTSITKAELRKLKRTAFRVTIVRKKRRRPEVRVAKRPAWQIDVRELWQKRSRRTE